MVSPTTTRKNKAAVHWNLAAVSTMIAYVNTSKGPDSPFFKDQHNALLRLGKELRPLLNAEDASRIEPNKIRDKLTHIWKNRKAKYHQIRDFWTHGLDALNHTALENEYPGVDFDKIKDWIDEVGDDGEPESSTAKRDRSESSDDDIEKARAGKKARSEKEVSPSARPSVSFLDQEIKKSLLRSRDDDGNVIFDSEQEDETTLAVNTGAHSKAPGRRQSGGKPCPPFSNRRPAHWSLTPNPEYTLKEQQFYTHFCSVEALNGNVDQIRKQITDAVTKYLAGLGFANDQAASLDFNTNQSPEFRGLLNVIMGLLPTTDWSETKRRLERSFSGENGRYRLSVVVEGFVGAALTSWCFVEYNWHYWFANDAMEPGVQDLLRRDMKDKDFQRFKLDAIRNNVRTNFAANVPKTAAQHAALFDKLLPSMVPARLAHLANGKTMEESPMPWNADAVDLSGGARVFKIPKTAFDQPKDVAAGPSATEPHDSWIKDLTAIFHNSLLLRAFLESPWEPGSLSNIAYKFTYPPYHEYDVDKTKNQVAIHAGMFPEIQLFKTNLDFPNLGGYIENQLPPVRIVRAKSKAVSMK